MTTRPITNEVVIESDLPVPGVVRQRYEQIADHLAQDVRAGRLRPGDRLPGERELAGRLGVGRASVREALAFLQVRGVVETRRGAGSFVADAAPGQVGALAPPTPADAGPAALLQARELFEPTLARLAAQAVAAADDDPRGEPAARRGWLATPDVELDGLLAEMERSSDAGDPAQRRRWSAADRLFHRRIAELTGNPVLAATGAMIAELMDQPLWQRLRDDAIAVPGLTTLQLAEHRLIAAAIAEGEPEAAEHHARLHVTRARRSMALDID